MGLLKVLEIMKGQEPRTHQRKKTSLISYDRLGVKKTRENGTLLLLMTCNGVNGDKKNYVYRIITVLLKMLQVNIETSIGESKFQG